MVASQPAEKRYICIAGKSGAGKETAYQLLRKKMEAQGLTVSIHHFSDSLNEDLDRHRIPKHRKNQQNISTILRTTVWYDNDGNPLSLDWSQEILSRTIQSDALDDRVNRVFLDGVRRPADLVMLRNLPGSVLVGIERDARLRHAGLRKRADRPGDAEKTWEQFQEEQRAETEQAIDQVVASADLKIVNNGTPEDLDRELDKVLELLK